MPIDTDDTSIIRGETHLLSSLLRLRAGRGKTSAISFSEKVHLLSYFLQEDDLFASIMRNVSYDWMNMSIAKKNQKVKA
jgi:hypothetical protein